MKSKAWYYRWPQTFHAWGPARFDSPISERELRESIRQQESNATGKPYKRLPNGFECWPTK